jgi:hypothetical protein
MVIVRLEGLGKLKNSTSSGPEPAIFRLVAWLKEKLTRNKENLKEKIETVQ